MIHICISICISSKEKGELVYVIKLRFSRYYIVKHGRIEHGVSKPSNTMASLSRRGFPRHPSSSISRTRKTAGNKWTRGEAAHMDGGFFNLP